MQIHKCRLEVGFGVAMRNSDMHDAQDHYEHEEDSIGGNVRVGNVDTESNGRIFQGTPPYFATTMRRLRAKMQSYREDNERFVRSQEEQHQLNAALL